MKYLFTVFFLVFTLTSFGQRITYDEWKEKAKTDIRFLPEYGHAVKTPEQIQTDKEFEETVLKQLGDKKKGSIHLVELGFNYLYKGDLQTAMYRFNQAWMIDSTNAKSYWGFGAIYAYFSDYDNALMQYNKGLKLDPESSEILTDKATIYMMKFQHGGTSDNLETAIPLFNQSYKLDANNQNTLYKLSICYFLKNDCVNAIKYHDLCMKLGGKPIDPGFTKALNEKCRK